MKKYLPITMIASAIIVMISMSVLIVSAQVEPPVIIEMDNKVTFTVMDNGDAQVKEVISMSAAAFANFRQQYPTLSMLARLFKSQRLDAELVDLKIEVDEVNNRVTATYVIKGVAVNKKDYWEIRAASEKYKITLSAQTENTLILTSVMQATSEIRMITTSTVMLPKEAKNIKFRSETNTIRYEYTPMTPVPSLQLTGNPMLLAAGGILVILAAVNVVLARRRALPLAQKVIICPRCGFANPPKAVFCTKCGNKLK
jgi:hypothetical protein